MGGESPGTSDRVSMDPSESASSALSNITSLFKKGLTSKSRLAMVVGFPVYVLSRVYRILALAAGTIRIGLLVRCCILYIGSSTYVAGTTRRSLEAGRNGSVLFKALSADRGCNTFVEAGMSGGR